MFAAETSLVTTGFAHHSTSFNGAAACSRRRPGTVASGSSKRSSLQWGRRMFAAETRSRRVHRMRLQATFNGAAACSRRRHRARPGVSRHDGSFNGAAACSRRRPDALRFLQPDAASFNGAAACSRRRPPGSHRARAPGALPSMGPPHVRGGDGARFDPGGSQLRTFNGAAACSRRRPAPEVCTAV